MSIYRLDPEQSTLFPDPHIVATDHPAAFGGDLSPQRLIAAYSQGYFPWYDRPPILWWNPDPRFVLFPDKLKVSKSMRPYFNQQKYRVTYDENFAQVIRYCRETVRNDQAGSWIDDKIETAYLELHKLGFAHSVEVYNQAAQLVGGLYGIALGRVFYGESMFAHARDASKFGFISLVRRLQERGYNLIDCQQETAHLASLGGEGIARDHFIELLGQNDLSITEQGKW